MYWRIRFSQCLYLFWNSHQFIACNFAVLKLVSFKFLSLDSRLHWRLLEQWGTCLGVSGVGGLFFVQGERNEGVFWKGSGLAIDVFMMGGSVNGFGVRNTHWSENGSQEALVRQGFISRDLFHSDRRCLEWSRLLGRVRLSTCREESRKVSEWIGSVHVL